MKIQTKRPLVFPKILKMLNFRQPGHNNDSAEEQNIQRLRDALLRNKATTPQSVPHWAERRGNRYMLQKSK